MAEKITQMTREIVRRLGAEAEEALKTVAEKYGLVVSRSGGSFDPVAGTCTPRFTFSCESADGVPTGFAANAPLVGLEPDDYGRKFNTPRGMFTICGVKLRNRKYPIIAREDETGRNSKFGPHIIPLIQRDATE